MVKERESDRHREKVGRDREGEVESFRERDSERQMKRLGDRERKLERE